MQALPNGSSGGKATEPAPAAARAPADAALLERQRSSLGTSTSTSPAATSSNGNGAADASSAGNGAHLAAQQQQQRQQEQRQQEQQQREQEKELTVLASLPAKEQGYEAIAAWVGLAVAFGAGIWYSQGAGKAQEYFAGYLLEQSLSVDNLFVFILVFNYFKTPPAAQKKVLTWGIATAAILRAIFIVAGVELIEVRSCPAR